MYYLHKKTKTKKTPWLVVRKRTIPTERPPLVSEASAKKVLISDNRYNLGIYCSGGSIYEAVHGTQIISCLPVTEWGTR
jgi:hypothetical protein